MRAEANARSSRGGVLVSWYQKCIQTPRALSACFRPACDRKRDDRQSAGWKTEGDGYGAATPLAQESGGIMEFWVVPDDHQPINVIGGSTYALDKHGHSAQI